MSQSDEAPKIELDKESSMRRDFCKATARTLRTVANRLTTCHHEGETTATEEALSGTEISIKFKVYITSSKI